MTINLKKALDFYHILTEQQKHILCLVYDMRKGFDGR